MNTTEISRRRALQGIAGVGVVGAGMTGSSVARGPPSDPCEGCGTLLAKYEWVEGEDGEDGEFVFEKGRESLGIDGDEFEFTVTETNEDGEPMAFEWESYAYNQKDPISGKTPGKIYDVSCMTVKAGPDVESVEYDWASSGSYSRDDKYAVSYVAFCIECAFWQIDFAGAPVADTNTEDPDDRETYLGRLVDYATHGRYGGGCGRIDIGSAANNLPVVSDGFTFTRDGHPLADGEIPTEASVSFGVTGDEPVDLVLSAYEMPGPFERSEIAWGPLFDAVEDTYAPNKFYRVNAGGPSVSSTTGPDWVDDDSGSQYSSDGQTYTASGLSAGDIRNPTDAPSEVFLTERYNDEQSWSFDVTAGQSYLVRLYFAEIYWGVATSSADEGDRVFDVSVGGKKILEDYDIVAETGGAKTATVETVEVTPTDGTLDVSFTTKENNAKISAIEVVEAPHTVTVDLPTV